MTEHNDRELLEKAAKAAGYKLHIWGTPGQENVARMDCEPTVRWNPLRSDGDAFQLAVKLEIEVCFFPGFREIHAEPASVYALGGAKESYADDMAAATRRAIVRAAASIGDSHD